MLAANLACRLEGNLRLDRPERRRDVIFGLQLDFNWMRLRINSVH
jgi:hypothetical protein